MGGDPAPPRKVDPLAPLIWIAVALALGIWAIVIVFAGWQSIQSPEQPMIPDVVTGLVTAVGAALATNFGATLGISKYMNGLGFRSLFTASAIRLYASANSPTKLQIGCAYLYFAMLIVAGAFWLADGLFSANTADIIKNMTATLGGVLVGIVVVQLSVKQA
jgi:hypothetical protein